MDVHCTTCAEPWDTYHLWHDLIHETGLTEEQIDVWRSLPQREKLNDCYRQEFKAIGWEFGWSVINVIRCACCPKAPSQIQSGFKLKLLWRNCLATMRTAWQPHSRIIAYEHAEVAAKRFPQNP